MAVFSKLGVHVYTRLIASVRALFRSQDERLHECMKRLSYVTLGDLGAPNLPEEMLDGAIDRLRDLDGAPTALEKICCVRDANQIISDAVQGRSGAVVSSPPPLDISTRAHNSRQIHISDLCFILLHRPPTTSCPLSYTASYKRSRAHYTQT